MNFFRFTLVELFLLMAYGAIVAWCFRIHWSIGVFCLCACFGLESGRKTAYPIFLMLLASQFMAALFVASIAGIQGIAYGYQGGAIIEMERGQTWAGQSGTVMFVLDAVLWLSSLGCFAWFVTAWSTVGRQQKRNQSHQMRMELQAIVDEKREEISTEKKSLKEGTGNAF